MVNKTYHNSALSRFFLNDLKNGSVFDTLNLDENSYKFKSKYFVFNIKNDFPIADHKIGDDFTIFTYNNGNNKKIMLIGDSNIGYISPFFATTFKKSMFLYAAGLSTRDNNWIINSYIDNIVSFKPDYLIIIVRARNLNNWVDLNDNK